jgi:DNA-binding PucR family transcriptional regulator
LSICTTESPYDCVVVEETAAVDRELLAIGAAVRAHLPDLTQEIWQRLTSSAPELRGDDMYEKLLTASIADNVAALLDVFEQGMPISGVHAPTAAEENARRMAQRQAPIVRLVRSYRIAHGRFLARCVEQLATRSHDSDLTLALVARLVDVTFDYIDQVSMQVIATYQRERDHWLLGQAAKRAARVHALLASNPADMDAAESALGYRLRARHLGVVAWLSGEPDAAKSMAELERLASTAARTLKARGQPLFVPRDEALAWIWLPLAQDTQITREALEAAFHDKARSLRVSVGEPAAGLDGFRRTHLQAVQTQNLALIATPGTRVTAFAEVGALALICSDRDTARSWVLATLNDLAIDDEPHARLRETLQLYLTTGSYTVTAERMLLHKNTAQYRVGKAEEALGAPIGERRADVELALRACHHLGRAVLRDPTPATH